MSDTLVKRLEFWAGKMRSWAQDESEWAGKQKMLIETSRFREGLGNAFGKCADILEMLLRDENEAEAKMLDDMEAYHAS